MRRYIDLTHPLHEGMMTFPAPWHPVVEITQLGRHSIEGRESYKIVVGTHTGTHTDSPAHMVDGGTPRIDKVPLETLIGKAKMINLPKGSLEKITVEDLENCGVKIGKGDRIAINTGWYKTWGTRKYFDERPCITPEAAQWLVDKGIIYLVLDIASPDDPLDKVAPGVANPIHHIFLSNGVILSEYCTNFDAVDRTEFEIIALPMLVKDMDGSPTRIVAVLED